MRKKYLSTHSGSVGRCHNSEVMELFCRIALPKSSDNRRSDILIPNGLFSDLILIVWCLVGFPLLIFGHWKSVMLSFLIIVFILKVVDVVGRQFGHNILRTNQEIPFYPLRLISMIRIISKQYCIPQHKDCYPLKLYTAKGILLQPISSGLVLRILHFFGGLGLCVVTGTDGRHLHWVCRNQTGPD